MYHVPPPASRKYASKKYKKTALLNAVFFCELYIFYVDICF